MIMIRFLAMENWDLKKNPCIMEKGTTKKGSLILYRVCIGSIATIRIDHFRAVSWDKIGDRFSSLQLLYEMCRYELIAPLLCVHRNSRILYPRSAWLRFRTLQ